MTTCLGNESVEAYVLECRLEEENERARTACVEKYALERLLEWVAMRGFTSRAV
jgi:hypothetical protein